MKHKPSFVMSLLLLLLTCTPHAYAEEPFTHFNTLITNTLSPSVSLNPDSLHNIHFHYADHKRGIKPFVAPTLLIGAGIGFHFSDYKYDLNDWSKERFNYQGYLDDYLLFGPMVAVFSLNALGIKGKNNFGNQSALLFKSTVISTVIVKLLKNWTKVERPSGGMDSFPSGHTALVFGMAQWMHHEYGEQSVWYSIGAYSCAASVGIMRIASGEHWISDVFVGAGIGMIATELAYLTHQYKWDWAHVKRFDILPFATGPQKGVTLVYNF